MTGILLSLHVIAAILAIGPVAVAASMFPVASRAALADPDSASVARRACCIASFGCMPRSELSFRCSVSPPP